MDASPNISPAQMTPEAFHVGVCSGAADSLENVSNKKLKKIQAPSDKGLLINIFAKEAKNKKT
jgi:hypothetical protein